MGRPRKIDKIPIAALEKEFTPEQNALLADIRLGRKDPVFFGEKLLGLEFHDGQKLWLWLTTRTNIDAAYELGLRLSDKNRVLWADRAGFDALLELNPDRLKNILVPSNRWGKTFTTSVKHIWYNFYKIGARGQPEQLKALRCGTMNLSPHSNQCQAGFEYVLDILFSKHIWTVMEPAIRDDGTTVMLPVSKKNACRIESFYLSDNSQKRTIMFSNGTFYKAVPTGEDQASSLAGNPYLYISYDECAQSLHLKAELPAKIMSRLIDFGGPLDLVSTPEVDKPSHQYFFHVAKLGLKCEEGWYTLIGKLSDNKFLGEKQVASIMGAIKSTDPAKYRQVAFGEFVTTGKKMFDGITIERLWAGFTPGLPAMGRHYLLVGDWGFSDTGDPTVFDVLDYTELLDERIPKHLRKIYLAWNESIQGGGPFEVLTRARVLQREWNGAKFIHDASSMGGVIIRKLLLEMNMTDIIDFSASGDKMDMLFCLIMVMGANRKCEVDAENKVIELNPDFGRLRSYYLPKLEEQMGNYQYNPAAGVSDKRLEQDEVMALGMGIWYLERKILKSRVNQAEFNPLAGNVGHIFPEKTAQALHMHSITIPEKRIM